MGRRNKSGVTYDKESYAYYKRLHAANKSYAERNGNEYSRLLTKREWEQAHASHDNKEIIYDAFHKWNRQTTEHLYQMVKELQIDDVKKSDINQGALSQEMWDLIDESYWKLKREGYDGKTAMKMNAHAFFGSP